VSELEDCKRRIVDRLSQDLDADDWVWAEVEADLDDWLPLADWVAKRGNPDLLQIIRKAVESPERRSRVRCVSIWGYRDRPGLISPNVFDLDPGETSPFMFRKYAEELVAAHPGQLELVPDGDPPAGADFVSPDVFDFLFGSRWKRATLAHAIAEVITGGAPSKDEHTLKGLISNSARPEIVRRMMKSTRDFQDKDKVKALFDRLDSEGIPCPASRPPRVNDPKQWGELKPGTPQYKRKIAILKRNLFPRRKSQNYDSGLT